MTIKRLFQIFTATAVMPTLALADQHQDDAKAAGSEFLTNTIDIGCVVSDIQHHCLQVVSGGFEDVRGVVEDRVQSTPLLEEGKEDTQHQDFKQLGLLLGNPFFRGRRKAP